MISSQIFKMRWEFAVDFFREHCFGEIKKKLKGSDIFQNFVPNMSLWNVGGTRVIFCYLKNGLVGTNLS